MPLHTDRADPMGPRVAAAAAGVVRPVASFRCIDAQEQAATLNGWHQAYWQLSRGAFVGTVDAVEFDGAYVFLESANRALLQRGYLAPGALAVAVPVRLDGPARFCGTQCTFDQAFVYSGRDGFEFCSPADHQVAGIALSPALMHSLGEAQRSAVLLQGAATQASAIAPDPRAVASMRSLVAGLIEALRSTPVLIDNPHTRSALRDAIIGSVCDVFDSGGACATLPVQVRARWALVVRAREMIDAAPCEPVTVASLCSALEVSRRTLQYCFQEVLGISPNAYLRAMRLNGARRALQTGSPSVTDAALDWGFWHLGQFSADYRQMFGELPSQTAQRHRGNAAG
jgi:AraC family transcriptional regulator, ethanolamine operon transcriptional activator